MKYLSLFILLILMATSWSAFHKVPTISQETHAGIQSDLKRIITEYVQENLPQSKDVKFERLWTETNNEKQVKATFTYSFVDSSEEKGSARVSIDGYAILNKAKSDNSELEVWNFDELFILNNNIQFEDPINITPTKTN